MKLHTLAFVAVKFRDAVSIYSRVEVRIEQVEKLKTSCQHTPGSLTSEAQASDVKLPGVCGKAKDLMPTHTRKFNI